MVSTCVGRAHTDILEKEATQHYLDALGIDRVALENAKQELEAKKWVNQQSLAVRAEIERLKQFKQYDDWKSLANSCVFRRS